MEKTVADFALIRFGAEFPRHRGDLRPREAAWNDALEVTQIRIHVERQAVISDAPAHSDADGGDFSIVNPDAGERRPACSFETEVFERANGRHLQISKIAMHVLSQL